MKVKVVEKPEGTGWDVYIREWGCFTFRWRYNTTFNNSSAYFAQHQRYPKDEADNSVAKFMAKARALEYAYRLKHPNEVVL